MDDDNCSLPTTKKIGETQKHRVLHGETPKKWIGLNDDTHKHDDKTRNGGETCKPNQLIIKRNGRFWLVATRIFTKFATKPGEII